MPETSGMLQMPDGSTFRIMRSPAETAGELIEIEMTVPPNSGAIPKHRHPLQEEEYEVLAGTFDVLYEGRWRALRTGEAIAVPRGAIHAFRGSNEVARVRNVHRPALDFDQYLQTLYGLAEAGGDQEAQEPEDLHLHVDALGGAPANDRRGGPCAWRDVAARSRRPATRLPARDLVDKHCVTTCWSDDLVRAGIALLLPSSTSTSLVARLVASASRKGLRGGLPKTGTCTAFLPD